MPRCSSNTASRLQDDVEPFSFADVETIVSEELGARLSKAFSYFDATPLAAASLGQVHRAALRDGRQVAVKVQRPGVRGQVVKDMEAMEEVATFLDAHTEMRRYGLKRMADEMRRSLLAELDYGREAQNLVTLHTNLARFRRIVIPQPIADYSTSRVLTMEFLSGQKITATSPVVLAEAGAADLAEELFRAYRACGGSRDRNG